MSKKVSMGTKPPPKPESPASADQWVESHKVEPSAPPTPPAAEKIKRLTLDLPASLHTRIKTACALRGTNMADEIRKLLDAHYQ